MTSDSSLSLILRRLDEIERKLDDVVQELRTPAAIGYSVRRGNIPKGRITSRSPILAALGKACFSHLSMALCTSFRSQQ